MFQKNQIVFHLRNYTQGCPLAFIHIHIHRYTVPPPLQNVTKVEVSSWGRTDRRGHNLTEPKPCSSVSQHPEKLQPPQSPSTKVEATHDPTPAFGRAVSSTKVVFLQHLLACVPICFPQENINTGLFPPVSQELTDFFPVLRAA